jgi:transcriptional regulator with PAS, ATPase and Fis domain
MSHDFPGNIRELENIIEYATLICKNIMIVIEHLPEYLCKSWNAKKETDSSENQEKEFSWNSMERSFIYETLRKNNWNRAATAAQLNIHTTTLWRKIKNLNIELPKQDGRTRIR